MDLFTEEGGDEMGSEEFEFEFECECEVESDVEFEVERKRLEYEMSVVNGGGIYKWYSYIDWEANENKNMIRARAIYERAVLDFTNKDKDRAAIWFRYAWFELRTCSPEAARRVFDRALAGRPPTMIARNLWVSYLSMEETIIGDVAAARRVYEKWRRSGTMVSVSSWKGWIWFEISNGEIERARAIYRELIKNGEYIRTPAQYWIDYANFENEYSCVNTARKVFEDAVERMSEPGLNLYCREGKELVKLLVAFAKFETKCKEIERARAIYKGGIELFPLSEILGQEYDSFRLEYGGGNIGM